MNLPTIVKATVVMRDYQLDAVYLHMNLPNPLWPYDGELTLKFDTSQGMGEAYLLEHFGVTAEVINTRKRYGTTENT